MAKPEGRIQCKNCSEWMTADHGPQKVPYHIRKGGIVKCTGTFGSAKAYIAPKPKKKRG